MSSLHIIESYESTSKLTNFYVNTEDIFLVFDYDSLKYLHQNFPENQVIKSYDVYLNSDLEEIFNDSYNKANEIIEDLEIQFSKKLNEFLGTKSIRFFETIYTYKSTYAIFQHKLHEIIIDKCLSASDIKKVYFFSGRSIFEQFFSLKNFLTFYLDYKEVQLVIQSNKHNYSDPDSIYQRLRLVSFTKIKSKTNQIFKALIFNIKNYLYGKQHGLKKILVLSGMKYISVFGDQKYQFINIEDLERQLVSDLSIDDKQFIEKIFLLDYPYDYIQYEYFISDFKINFKRYILLLKNFKEKDLINNFDAFFWGLPLIFEPSKSLLVDLAIQEDLKVYGRQHGCSYCTQIDILHMNSDFNRCSVYFSYGFGKQELRNTYPFYEPSFKIVKSPPKIKSFKVKKRIPIDITFPIANSKAEFIAEQESIIRALILRDDLRVVIKSISAPNTFFRFNQLINEYPHIKLINNVSFSDYLKDFQSKLFIFEVPSTTLDEAINQESDLFVRTSRIFQYSSLAEESLSKRASIFSNNNDLYNAILQYNPKNQLPLRDKSYFNIYLSDE